jgi:hypothetical protein
MLPDHVGGNVDIIGTRQVIRLRAAQETETVLHHLEHAITRDFPAFIGPFAQDLEHHVALAHGRGVLDLQLLRHGKQVLGGLCLQVGKAQTGLGHGIHLSQAGASRALVSCLDLCVSDHAGRRNVGQLSSDRHIVKELVLPRSF